MNEFLPVDFKIYVSINSLKQLVSHLYRLEINSQSIFIIIFISIMYYGIIIQAWRKLEYLWKNSNILIDILNLDRFNRIHSLKYQRSKTLVTAKIKGLENQSLWQKLNSFWRVALKLIFYFDIRGKNGKFINGRI